MPYEKASYDWIEHVEEGSDCNKHNRQEAVNETPVRRVRNLVHLIILKDGIASDVIASSLKNSSHAFSTVSSIEAAYEALMKNEQMVLLASSIESSYIGVMSCSLETIPYNALYEVILTFPYSKSWIFGSQIDFYLSIVSKSGVLTDAASVYFMTGRCYHPNYKIPMPSVLDLADNASTYIFLLIGIVTSFILMGLEVLVRRILGEREAKDLTPLVQGRHYTAKIVAIKRNGVSVTIGNRPEHFFIPNNQLHTDPLKVYNALDMGLTEGAEIEVTYFGDENDSNTPLFCRYFANE
uniref:PBPe domain-containing protein n=1 Tax=Mesocestoides corti TaxID=53468 RepID=A0A5K3FRR2_MESCO